MKALPLLVLMLAIGAVACDENPVSPTEIRNVTWKLESIERPGTATITVPNPEQYTLRFEDDGGWPCGRTATRAADATSLDGSSLSIGDVACTLIACPVPGLDTTFTSALRNVRSATVSDRPDWSITGTGFHAAASRS